MLSQVTQLEAELSTLRSQAQLHADSATQLGASLSAALLENSDLQEQLSALWAGHMDAVSKGSRLSVVEASQQVGPATACLHSSAAPILSVWRCPIFHQQNQLQVRTTVFPSSCTCRPISFECRRGDTSTANKRLPCLPEVAIHRNVLIRCLQARVEARDQGSDKCIVNRCSAEGKDQLLFRFRG